MPPRKKPPLTDAERQRECRRRQREGTLCAVSYVPLHHAEGLIDAGLLPQQDAADPRALGAALLQSSECHVKKTVTP